MEGMQRKGCVCRIRKCMFDFISMEDDLIDDDEDSWDLIGRELRLKATFLYCDLNQIISNTRDGDKNSLTDLANKLFYFMEELHCAVKSRSISLTQACYSDTTHVLQEVMAALLHSADMAKEEEK